MRSMATGMNDGGFSNTLRLTNDTNDLKELSVPFQVPDHSLSDSTSHIPVLKQVIPVAVLAALLLIFFASHILRYPRILHPVPLVDTPSDSEETLHYRQRRKRSPGKVITQSGPFWRISLSRTNVSKAQFSSDMSARYSVPTVRLVREHIHHSPEPRLYLPEEITLPLCSPTLVGSSASEFFAPILEMHGVPPRVYLSPTLPEIRDSGYLGFCPQKEGDAYVLRDASAGTDTIDISPEQQPASSPHLAPTAINNFLNTSSDTHILPFVDLQASSSDTCKPENDSFAYDPVLPELSPPPAALAHPILARRALSLWRSRFPPESPYDTVLERTTVHTGNADPRQAHRPSIPSRLRFFITRSASASLTSSRTQSTPESSLGKRSEKSSRASRPRHHQRSSRSSAADSHVEAADASQCPRDAAALPEGAQTPPVAETTAVSGPQLHEADPAPDIISADPRPPRNDRLSFFEPPSPEPSEGGEDDAPGACDERGWFPDPGPRSAARAAERARFGLGLRAVSAPAAAPPAARPRPPSGVRPRAAAAAGTGEAAGGHLRPARARSLRTVLARWMAPGRGHDNTGGTIDEEASVGGGSGAADTSVEIMVVDRRTSVWLP